MVLYGYYYMDMRLNVKEIFGGKYFAEKWQQLQIVALKAEHTVLLSADVEGPTIKGKCCCRVR